MGILLLNMFMKSVVCGKYDNWQLSTKIIIVIDDNWMSGS
jgi:hypothetical protein